MRVALGASLLASLCFGCGRLGFDAVGDASLRDGSTLGDGGADASHADPDASVVSPRFDVVFSADTNLSFVNTGDRTCPEGGDMVSYSVTELTTRRAVLSTSPGPGCLATGDEVLLINLQGTASSSANVGHFELLRIESATGSEVRFMASKQKLYGAAADDSQIGTAQSQQRVMLMRVPRYGDVLVESGARLIARTWDGAFGGVLAMRVLGTLRLDGNIDVTGLGYQGGSPTALPSTTGAQGESIRGLGAASMQPNAGGGGGGLGDGMGCRQSGSPGGGGGHGSVGIAGSVPDCSGIGGGRAGASVGDVSRLLLGSGGGAGGTDNLLTDNPPGGAGGRGGGVALIMANRLIGAGSVRSTGAPGQGDAPGLECSGGDAESCWDHSGPGGGGAGGSVWLEASSVDDTITISVSGGAGGNGNDALSGNGGAGAAGRVRRTP